MRIKSIEIQGFKSFPDFIKLDLQEPITAIVGPNGCGKSNISDAIRWVLGEQSHKQLRGRKMEDIIFNGTSGRKPVGLASVSFSLIECETGTDGNGFSEINISRKLYRSGESQYFINKVSCRLKDIVDLFLTKGGNNAMTVFEQSQVLALVSSKPEERRFLIEEAAEIVPFKHRKLAALKKLEHTEQNLLRLGDIIEEVKNQYQVLHRQVRKVEIYRKYQGEIRELEVALLSKEAGRLASEFRDIMSYYTEEERIGQEMGLVVDSLEKDLLMKQAEKEEKEQGLAHLQQKTLSFEAEIHRLQEKLESIENQLKSINEETEQSIKENSELVPRTEAEEEKIQALEENISSFDTQLQAREHDFFEQEQRVGLLKEQLSSGTSLLGRLKGDLVDLLREITAQRNAMLSAKGKLEEAEKRKEWLDKELDGEKDALLEMEEKFEESRLGLENALSLLELRQRDKDFQAGNLEHLWTECNLQGEKITELEKRISEVSARLKALTEMEKEFEGYADSVKTLLAHEPEEKGWLKGLLIKMIEVDKGYEVAIEAALSEKLQGLITEDVIGALTGVELLKNRKWGKATFLTSHPLFDTPQKEIKSSYAGQGGGEMGFVQIQDIEMQDFYISADGILGKAGNFVQCRSECKGIIARLLGDIIIVNNPDTVLKILKNQDALSNGTISALTFVTLEGDLFAPQGIIRGGSPDSKEGYLFKRQNEIKELHEQREILIASLDQVKGKFNQLQDEKNEAQEEIKRLGKVLTDLEIEKTSLEKDLLYHEKDMKKSKEKMALFQFEASQILERKDGLLEELEYRKVQLEDLTGQQRELDDRLTGVEEESAGIQKALEQEKEQLSHLKFSLAEIKAKKETAIREAGEIRQSKRELEERVVRLREKIARQRDKSLSLEKTKVDAQSELNNDKERLKELKEELLVERQSFNSFLEAVKNKQQELSVKREELTAKTEKMKAMIAQKTEMEVKLEYLTERAKSEFQINLNDLEKISDQIGEVDLPMIQNRMSELKEKKSKLGEVNSEAIEEFKEIAERYEFLQKQHSDLVTSIDDLRKLIEKIDKAIKDRFDKTFKQVNEEFQKVFKRLFGGGEACLIFSEEDNLLETGVDIMANPPGKRMQNLLLLSAGEKSLTALALLFSVFLTKPSPFCLLDEVDAPLDEANIVRFCQLVEELSSQTQFIIITHNKKTMAFARVLYGVTMEEEGVSRVISLSLKDGSK
ncbi:MAG: chromosome segregation protein SMC [Candidatus Tectomicrobia bacterium]|uniref:Chromosome partition protein Smc n=1 Tax=Tectimicrobiota bacterium TaxID=2528274 RepID=A0A933LPX7_UNCTE|nr:chromosome segregation protein SMC [Candidatus Tectomicrobia bacterium]